MVARRRPPSPPDPCARRRRSARRADAALAAQVGDEAVLRVTGQRLGGAAVDADRRRDDVGVHAVEVEQVGAGDGMGGTKLVGFETHFGFNRSDFGMDFMLGGISDEIGVILSVEAGK